MYATRRKPSIRPLFCRLQKKGTLNIISVGRGNLECPLFDSWTAITGILNAPFDPPQSLIQRLPLIYPFPVATNASSKSASSLERAIVVFARGFAFTRSLTYPSQALRVRNVWVIRDNPRKRSSDYRREEWVAHRIHAAEVDAIARRETRGRFCICAIRGIDEPDEPIRAAYKAAGYRLGTTESLMLHRLAKIPDLKGPLPVHRVMTQEIADRLTKAAGRRHIRAEHLVPDAPLRQYVALDAGKPVGWATSIAVDDSTWVSSMYVAPKYRRRGIGKSILAKMLRDDRANGSIRSCLLASHAGAMLYPTVGYESIGQLLLYTPKKQ